MSNSFLDYLGGLLDGRVDFSGNVTFETVDDFRFSHSFGGSSLHILRGPRIVTQPDHNDPIERRVSLAIATAFDAVCAGVSTFTFGMLVRHIPVRILGATGFMMLATASVLTIYANNIQIVFISMAVFGLGIGGMMFLQNFVWADYFGRENVGSIRGLVNPINLVAGGLGAPAAGYVRDFTGSYDPAWWVGVGLMVFAAMLTLATPAPTKRTEGEGERASRVS